MLCRILCASIFLCVFAPPKAQGRFDHEPAVEELAAELAGADAPPALANRTDRALDAMIRLAAWKLRREGHGAAADRIELRWLEDFRGFLPALVRQRAAGAEDLGDHAPLSQWLADVYAELVALLGEPVLRFLHLDDINIVNFAIPVVFHLDVLGDDVIDAAEYELHFDPFAGVVAYWGVWISCEVATWGSGWFLVCVPAATASEHAVITWIAPRLADDAYRVFYRQE